MTVYFLFLTLVVGCGGNGAGDDPNNAIQPAHVQQQQQQQPQDDGPGIIVGPKIGFGPSWNIGKGRIELGPSFDMGPHIPLN